MPEFTMALLAIGVVVAEASAAFAIVYFGARLAIRHERRSSD
jgi:hypothetical protein